MSPPFTDELVASFLPPDMEEIQEVGPEWYPELYGVTENVQFRVGRYTGLVEVLDRPPFRFEGREVVMEDSYKGIKMEVAEHMALKLRDLDGR